MLDIPDWIKQLAALLLYIMQYIVNALNHLYLVGEPGYHQSQSMPFHAMHRISSVSSSSIIAPHRRRYCTNCWTFSLDSSVSCSSGGPSTFWKTGINRSVNP